MFISRALVMRVSACQLGVETPIKFVAESRVGTIGMMFSRAAAISGPSHSTFCTKYVQLVDAYGSKTMFLDNLSKKPL